MIRKIVIVLLVLALLPFVLMFVASESGEVVVLSSLDADGKPQETRLWVVDLNGYQYLRAGDPASGWYARIRANGRVGLQRGDTRAAYDAIAEPGVRDTVNDLVRAKYGLADQYISALLGRDDATPIRLEIYHEYPEDLTEE